MCESVCVCVRDFCNIFLLTIIEVRSEDERMISPYYFYHIIHSSPECGPVIFAFFVVVRTNHHMPVGIDFFAGWQRKGQLKILLPC